MKYLKVTLSIFVGLVFVLYGVVKLFKMQAFNITFPPGTLLVDVTRPELFWYFFGQSYPYLIYLGIAEVGAGLMLAIPKTTRLGALACAMLGANITIFDFVYDIGPVRYWALFLTLCCVFLILAEWKLYKNVLLTMLK